jgi:hypothetical protein
VSRVQWLQLDRSISGVLIHIRPGPSGGWAATSARSVGHSHMSSAPLLGRSAVGQSALRPWGCSCLRRVGPCAVGADNQIGDAGATALAGALGSGKCAVTTLQLYGAWHGRPSAPVRRWIADGPAEPDRQQRPCAVH